MKKSKFTETQIVQMLKEADAGIAAAVAADAVRASGGTVGPLHGLPVIVKDAFDIAGLPTTAGTPSLVNNVPAATSPAVKSLLDSGAILVGKANLHELSSGGTTNNAFTGSTHNPYDLTRVPGGSSGGNGAALAARFAPFALGEDTGGSGRVPCALSGCIGFRATTGRYPNVGLVPLAPSFDSPAPEARSVEDIALIDQVLTGSPVTDFKPLSVKGMRIGVPRGFFYNNLDPAVSAAAESALLKLTEAGALLVEADLPLIDDKTTHFWSSIVLFEIVPSLNEYLANAGGTISIYDLYNQISSPDVKDIFELVLSGPISPDMYQEAIEYQADTQYYYQNYFTEHAVEAIIYPTVPIPAPPIGQDYFIELNGQQVSTSEAIGRNTMVTAFVGCPAISIGLGQTPDTSLPMGLDVAGPIGSDTRLLAIAAGIDSVLRPSVRPPPLFPEPSY